MVTKEVEPFEIRSRDYSPRWLAKYTEKSLQTIDQKNVQPTAMTMPLSP